MITVGLVNEINFISKALNSSVKIDFSVDNIILNISIENQMLKISHEGELIWLESLDETTGNFGIESCQHVFSILSNKANGQEYRHLIYKEKA